MKYKREPYGAHEYAIELLEHKFSGIQFKYGKVQFLEQEDNLTLKYHYDIIESKIEDSDKAEFEHLIGDVLMQMLSDGVKNNDLVYSGGTDAN